MHTMRLICYLTKSEVQESSLWAADQGSPSDSQTIEVTAFATGYLPVFENKTVLYKTPHTLDWKLWGTDLELTKKPPPSGITLIGWKGVMQVSKREKKSIVLSGYGVYEPQQWPFQQDSPKNARVHILVVIDSCLTGLSPIHYEGMHAW